MDEKEKREKEELKQQLHDMNIGQKLEYFWMYYKWVIVCVIAAVFIGIATADWIRNAQDRTILGIMAANSYTPLETAEEEIKEILGETDAHDRVDITGTISFDPEKGTLDYYSQMAFLANLANRDLDLIFLPEIGIESVKDALAPVSLEDLFGDEAEKYRDSYVDGFLRLPEGNEAARLFSLGYEPVWAVVVDGGNNTENAAEILKVLLEP